MEALFEIVFQFAGEILLQMAMQCLAELGAHSLHDTIKTTRNPILSTIGFALWGALLGAISLLIFSRSPIADIHVREINLLVTPLIAGATTALIGRARARRGQDLVRLDRFGYAFVFALAMAIVRFLGVR